MNRCCGARHCCTDGKLVTQYTRLNGVITKMVKPCTCAALYSLAFHVSKRLHPHHKHTFLNLMQQLIDGHDQFWPIKSSQISESQTSESMFNVKRLFACRNLCYTGNTYKCKIEPHKIRASIFFRKLKHFLEANSPSDD
jgi:hypothetical protein